VSPGSGARAAAAAPRLHLPSLGAALAIMLAGTLYPPLMADAAGHADHRLALALFWAMSAGFVRGVGFVPHPRLLRWLYSGWSCALALAIAAGLAFGPALGLGA
jgi:predicted membrane protein